MRSYWKEFQKVRNRVNWGCVKREYSKHCEVFGAYSMPVDYFEFMWERFNAAGVSQIAINIRVFWECCLEISEFPSFLDYIKNITEKLNNTIE